MRPFLIVGLALATIQSAKADPADGVTIPARLECSALMPKRNNDAAFTSPITLNYSQGKLTANRQRISDNGIERFTGTVDPLGRVQMTATYGDKQSYIYKFSGQLDDKRPTVLRGNVEITSGSIGRRSCTIAILAQPREVMAAFSR